jgi:hypothetical protein
MLEFSLEAVAARQTVNSNMRSVNQNGQRRFIIDARQGRFDPRNLDFTLFCNGSCCAASECGE